MPTLTPFKGDSDPESHLKHFRSVMILYKGNDALICKVFAMTVRGSSPRLVSYLSAQVYHQLQRKPAERKCLSKKWALKRSQRGWRSIRLISIAWCGRVEMMMLGLERLVLNLKSKLRSLKVNKKPYDKIEKSESMRVEIRSKKARKLIEKTLKVADSPKSKTFAFL
ncbi:PREDICTED: PRUPE_3G242600 [Prunus dulcis]|uniref:PREDICTED: PRUPE_3G242600 n=3 Tax=Prunus TaxID=3754 RepID=A0A5E4EW94_PRUDU|nr:hypothetical protein L3X38_019897 [Prunus dulcis]VVA19079.1 PREDICTED: PRUPE_3G242600 [Prunus dulcis]